MTLSRMLRVLALIGLLVAFVAGATGPVSAAEEPTATVGQADCVDGTEVTKVNLTAADGADTTFTTVVTNSADGDEVFRDDDRTVPAGTSEKVSVPGLTYGNYLVIVTVAQVEVLRDGIHVGCPPVGSYKNAGIGGGGGCEGERTYSFSNRPIKGATGDLLPVRFSIVDGDRVLYTVILPEDDPFPYEASVEFAEGELPQGASVLVDGEQPTFPIVWSMPSCAPPGPPLPETGA